MATVKTEPMAAAGQVVLKYAVDGIIGQGNWTTVFTNAATTLTSISNASPAVFTKAAHGLANGTEIVLNTTGALPTGLTVGTRYYVVSTATDTFQVSITPGGSSVNTTAAGSGTHGYILEKNSIAFSAVTSLPKDYKEIAWRLESTGNAEITEFEFVEEITEKKLYSF